MRTKPFVIIQNGRPIFTVYARSIEAARAIVSARIAGEFVVVDQIGQSGRFAATRDGAAR